MWPAGFDEGLLKVRMYALRPNSMMKTLAQ
jgi:hypothetical protein